jgi:hydroxymethylbilane synthase
VKRIIRIGTRESQLAVWQATQVKELLAEFNHAAELVYIKSEGDIDLKTPLYEMGVQGIFTRSLDAALLNERIDVAVHSMKDVPTQLPPGSPGSGVATGTGSRFACIQKQRRFFKQQGCRGHYCHEQP